MQSLRFSFEIWWWIQNIEYIWNVKNLWKHNKTGNKGNVTSPELPGVIAGVKVADLLKVPAAKLKQILSFPYVIPFILITGRQERT